MHLPSPERTPKLQLVAEQPLTGECWIPPKKYSPHPRAKEKPQQDGRRSRDAFRIKPHTWQRCLEGSNKTLCAPGPETPQRLSQSCLCGLSVSCGGTSQQCPAVGTGALGATDLGGAACGISPLRGGHHEPHHRATKQATHKLENSYTKEVLALLWKF